jgi:predicted nuclease of predicted toxin-antitoxin system
MKFLADIHISPLTVNFLSSKKIDIIRVNNVLPITASDHAIVEEAIQTNRIIITQDLDFSSIVALSGLIQPSVITLRLSSSKIEIMNSYILKTIETVHKDLIKGALVVVNDRKIRIRELPIAD